jgi:Flp pilus assembly pilin Flp
VNVCEPRPFLPTQFIAGLAGLITAEEASRRYPVTRDARYGRGMPFHVRAIGGRSQARYDRFTRSRSNGNEPRRPDVVELIAKFWNDDAGQDVSEYAVMLSVMLVVVVATVKLIGAKSNNIFSAVGSTIK